MSNPRVDLTRNELILESVFLDDEKVASLVFKGLITQVKEVDHNDISVTSAEALGLKATYYHAAAVGSKDRILPQIFWISPGGKYLVATLSDTIYYSLPILINELEKI